MLQKVIQVGNSLALTIPKSFANQVGFKAGDELLVLSDADNKSLIITVKENAARMKLSPEFFSWLDTIETEYSPAIKELAEK